MEKIKKVTRYKIIIIIIIDDTLTDTHTHTLFHNSYRLPIDLQSLQSRFHTHLTQKPHQQFITKLTKDTTKLQYILYI